MDSPRDGYSKEQPEDSILAPSNTDLCEVDSQAVVEKVEGASAPSDVTGPNSQG